MMAVSMSIYVECCFAKLSIKHLRVRLSLFLYQFFAKTAPWFSKDNLNDSKCIGAVFTRVPSQSKIMASKEYADRSIGRVENVILGCHYCSAGTKIVFVASRIACIGSPF